MSLFDSSNFVNFMSSNIIKCGVQNPQDQHKTSRGTVKVRPILAVGSIAGMPNGKVYWLDFAKATDQSDDVIEIYWAPYFDDQVAPPTMLGNKSNFMFTAVMSGCSFGVGSAAGKGIVGVSHANAKRSGSKGNSGLEGEAAMKQQKNIQQHMLYSEDMSQHIISYEAYMKLNGSLDLQVQTTTFGVHELNKSWSFYTLRYKYLGGGNYNHYGVQPQVLGVG